MEKHELTEHRRRVVRIHEADTETVSVSCCCLESSLLYCCTCWSFIYLFRLLSHISVLVLVHLAWHPSAFFDNPNVQYIKLDPTVQLTVLT